MGIQAIALVAALFLQGPKLEMKDLTSGTGRAAQAKDVVTVEYTGTLTDGKQFDTSKGKAPLVFTIGAGDVIPGWDQGLVGMKVGGERELTIPPNLGYGDQANGDIPANSTLKFDVKLLNIERPGDQDKIDETVEKPGTGDPPQPGDVIDLQYTGTFLNGVKFDSSYDRSDPLHITVGHAKLIKGFTEGIEGIKAGEKRRIVIPASLGYGPQQRGPIPGNSVLTFEIEAVKVTPKAEVAKMIDADRKKLKIEDTAKGDGSEIEFGDVVAFQLKATLPDGKVIADTHAAKGPVTLQVGASQLTRGLDVGLVGMKVGGKRKITVPAVLAYGSKGAGNGTIPPNSDLTFEVEIVSIEP